MKDPAKGLNSVQMNVSIQFWILKTIFCWQVARIICKCAWGKVTPPVETDAAELPVWTLIHDQLSWNRPAQGQLKDASISVEDLVNYEEYLQENYPHKPEEPKDSQNKNLYTDRVLSFARAGGAGAKFKNL